MVGINALLFGGYMLMSGPASLMYRKYFTLDAGSSITSLPLAHIGHTSAAAFLFNSGILWTLGHYHVSKYGCAQFMAVYGLSCAVATAVGVLDVR